MITIHTHNDRKARLLVVEDEPAIRNGLVDVFVFHGYDVAAAVDGREGLHMALSGDYDLILLDVMMPHLDGFEVCRRIREQDKEQAIIMLTARSADDDIVNGLSLGADDYVAKPFAVTQLVLRVQAVLRRTLKRTELPQTLRLANGVELDTLNLQARHERGIIHFTRREMDVLEYLYQHHTRPVSREELLHKVWGYRDGLDIETRTVDIHIAKIRRKLERSQKEPELLLTLRGAGYKLMIAPC
jgi:two-component system response regulator RegX3